MEKVKLLVLVVGVVIANPTGLIFDKNSMTTYQKIVGEYSINVVLGEICWPEPVVELLPACNIYLYHILCNWT